MKMQKQILLTQQGLKDLEEELDILKTVKRKEMAEKIKLARSYGDLSENSEYDDAKNEQAIMEARIADIEVMLKSAKVIDESEISNEHVHIGSKVKVYDNDFEEELVYHIVSASEADPENDKISDESPIGHALLEKKVGEKVHIELPNGSSIQLDILEITR
ncbi:MAG: transcription elongation factor GreA [Lachnospiraceae bacterium]|nr:transcription elongation factor GreA [Lachnospiraceae bacterium]